MIDRRMALPGVFAALVSLGSIAHADQALAKATAAFEDLRYRDAVRLSDAAWRAGGNSPSELRRLFALAGTAAGSMGDAAAAQIWFGRWLCLDPEARLPAGSSPKLAQLLDAARRELAGRALLAHAASDESGITVVVEDDPLALAVSVRAGDMQRLLAAGRATLATRDAIAVLDRYGNALVELAVPVTTLMKPVVAPPAVQPSWYARWPVWAAVAVGGAVVGGVALRGAADADAKLDDLAAHSDTHEYSEARAQEQRLDRDQWIARVAFGAALASATVAVVCVLRGHEVRASVVPTGGGAAMTWSIRY